MTWSLRTPAVAVRVPAPQPAPAPPAAAMVFASPLRRVARLPLAAALRLSCSAASSQRAALRPPPPPARTAGVRTAALGAASPTWFQEQWARLWLAEHNQLPAEAKRLHQLKLALTIESMGGHADVEGRTRTRFSAYAAGAFEQLAQEAPAWLPRDAPLRILAADFARYPSLPPPRREALVAEAAAVVARALDGWAASAPSARAAAGPAAANGVRMLDTGGQRSEAWFQKRDALLTASSFGNILGFWGEDRLHQIWEERLGLRPRFEGNELTRWGTRMEPHGLAAYTLLTGRSVDSADLGELPPDSPGAAPWLGASPDGLVRDGEGVLEIKCPTGGRAAAGNFRLAAPYPTVPAYYVPQLLGLMAVFDRRYADLFCFTAQQGCSLFRVEASPEVWDLMRTTLHAFWHDSVLPARAALAQGASAADVEQWRPRLDVARAEAVKAAAARLSQEAETQHFASPAEETLQQLIAQQGLE